MLYNFFDFIKHLFDCTSLTENISRGQKIYLYTYIFFVFSLKKKTLKIIKMNNLISENAMLKLDMIYLQRTTNDLLVNDLMKNKYTNRERMSVSKCARARLMLPVLAVRSAFLKPALQLFTPKMNLASLCCWKWPIHWFRRISLTRCLP